MKRAAFLTLAVALAACQGSIGSTPPVGAPGGVQPNAVGQVANVGGPGASRAKTSEAVVKFSKDLTTVTFPNTEGYGLVIELASPSPGPSSSGKPSPGASALTTGVTKTLGLPTPAASGSPSPSPAASGSSSPAASGSPSASPSASPSPSPSSAGKKTPAPPITVKLSVYPDTAPAGPTPDPDSSPPPTPIADRVAMVRGYFKSPVNFTVSSLDAFRFTIPADEFDKSRGYTIALYSVPDAKNVAQTLLGSHKDPSTRLAFTTNPLAEAPGLVHAGPQGGGPIRLFAGTGYAVILFADQRAVAAPPAGLPAAPGPAGQPGQPSPLQFGQTPVPGQPLTQPGGLYGQPAQPGTPGPISTVPPHP